MYNFLDYLQHKDLISEVEREEVIHSILDMPYKNDIYYIYCFSMTSDEIKRINDVLINNKHKSFERVAIELGFFTAADVETISDSSQYAEIIQAQTLIDFGFLTPERAIEYLDAYKLDSLLESTEIGEIGVELNEGDSLENFANEYIKIITSRLSNFDETLEVSEIEIVDKLSCEIFVYQTLLDIDGNCEFVTGLSGNLHDITCLTTSIYNQATQNLTVEYDEESKFEAIDICCEF